MCVHSGAFCDGHAVAPDCAGVQLRTPRDTRFDGNLSRVVIRCRDSAGLRETTKARGSSELLNAIGIPLIAG